MNRFLCEKQYSILFYSILTVGSSSVGDLLSLAFNTTIRLIDNGLYDSWTIYVTIYLYLSIYSPVPNFRGVVLPILPKKGQKWPFLKI